ncbi:MAG: response regulator transcription factor [Holophagales bacterium]|nr:response regulator transcription factor [Holophagales bacterium]
MSRQKIVVVEDEPDILEVIEYNLSREGYQVIAASTGDEGLEATRRQAPDLILLDLLLPGLDGLEVCRKLKMDPVTQRVPIIMVSAKGEESDIVLGLGVGADDYITKPFRPKELIARVKAVLRRGSLRDEDKQGDRVVRGPLMVDATRHEVRIDAEPVELTATEFRLLHLLASHPGRVFTRDQLVSRVIGGGAAVIDRNIDVHVRSIRKKLAEHRHLIGTVRGVGYRFQDDAYDD